MSDSSRDLAEQTMSADLKANSPRAFAERFLRQARIDMYLSMGGTMKYLDDVWWEIEKSNLLKTYSVSDAVELLTQVLAKAGLPLSPRDVTPEQVVREWHNDRVFEREGGQPVSDESWEAIKRLFRDQYENELSLATRAFSAGACAPIPMLLFCPKCGVQHIDAPDERTLDWDNPPHRSHLCHGCGCIWRPAAVLTTGVESITPLGKSDTWKPGPESRDHTFDVRSGHGMETIEDTFEWFEKEAIDHLHPYVGSDMPEWYRGYKERTLGDGVEDCKQIFDLAECLQYTAHRFAKAAIKSEREAIFEIVKQEQAAWDLDGGVDGERACKSISERILEREKGVKP